MYKGAPELKLSDLPETTIALAIVLTGVVVAALSILFWLPFVYAKVVKRDYTLRWYHFFMGPLLWRRPAPEVSLDVAVTSVPDYRVYNRDVPQGHEGMDAQRDIENRLNPVGAAEREHSAETPSGSGGGEHGEKNVEGHNLPHVKRENSDSTADATHKHQRVPLSEVEAQSDAHPIEGPWILPKNLWIILRYRIPMVLLHGSSVDVHKLQSGGGSSEEKRIAEMHVRAKQYENEVSPKLLPRAPCPSCRCIPSFSFGTRDSTDLATDRAPLLVPPSLDRLHQLVRSRCQRRLECHRALCRHLLRLVKRCRYPVQLADPNLDAGLWSWYARPWSCHIRIQHHGSPRQQTHHVSLARAQTCPRTGSLTLIGTRPLEASRWSSARQSPFFWLREYLHTIFGARGQKKKKRVRTANLLGNSPSPPVRPCASPVLPPVSVSFHPVSELSTGEPSLGSLPVGSRLSQLQVSRLVSSLGCSSTPLGGKRLMAHRPR